MLPIDVQAEIIRSFQEEKRQRFIEEQARQRAATELRRSWRARFLRATGNGLVTAGRALERAAGAPLAAEFDSRRLSAGSGKA